MLDTVDERTVHFSGPLDMPDEHGPTPDEDAGPGHSLTDDIAALLDDGRTYIDAELHYQKRRIGFVGDRLKGAVAYGLGAFALLHLALIAATVGIVIALTPLIGPWLAMLAVTVAMAVAGYFLARRALAKVDQIAAAFSDKQP